MLTSSLAATFRRPRVASTATIGASCVGRRNRLPSIPITKPDASHATDLKTSPSVTGRVFCLAGVPSLSSPSFCSSLKPALGAAIVMKKGDTKKREMAVSDKGGIQTSEQKLNTTE